MAAINLTALGALRLKILEIFLPAQEKNLYSVNLKMMAYGVVPNLFFQWVIIWMCMLQFYDSDTQSIHGWFLCAFAIYSVVLFLHNHIWINQEIWNDDEQFYAVLSWSFAYISLGSALWFSYLIALNLSEKILLEDTYVYLCVLTIGKFTINGTLFQRVRFLFIIVAAIVEASCIHLILHRIDFEQIRYIMACVIALLLLLNIQNKVLFEVLKHKWNSSELAKKLSVKNEELKAVNLSQAAYLSAASHDLRQPLQALSLIAYNVNARNEDPYLYEPLLRMDQAIDSLSKSFDTMLNLSRLDSGIVHFHESSFPIQKLFERLKLEFEGIAAQKNVSLSVVHTKIWITSDEGILYSILSNFVSNAIRYTEKGGVVIGVRHVGDKHLDICVYDSGIGIPKEKTQSIFEEYQRLDYAKQRVRGGVGLGLAISERMADLLGSRLFVRSVLSKGSVFGIRLSDAKTEPSHLPLESFEHLDNHLSGLKVGVVEDDSEAVGDLMALLKSWRMKPSLIQSPLMLLELIREQGDFDILITDYHLGMDKNTGFEMLKAVREAQPNHEPLCVLLTGNTSAEVSDVTTQLDYYLLYKPVSPNRLYSTLNMWVYQMAHIRDFCKAPIDSANY